MTAVNLEYTITGAANVFEKHAHAPHMKKVKGYFCIMLTQSNESESEEEKKGGERERRRKGSGYCTGGKKDAEEEMPPPAHECFQFDLAGAFRVAFGEDSGGIILGDFEMVRLGEHVSQGHEAVSATALSAGFAQPSAEAPTPSRAGSARRLEPYERTKANSLKG